MCIRDRDTVFTGTITFTDANAELVTNLNTAYEVSADDFLTVEGSDEKVLNNATGKLTLAAPDGGTLTIDDAITYSSDGLKALRDAYINDANSALELNPVSYTHLDVYKRQAAAHDDDRRQLRFLGHRTHRCRCR